jgi:uncharacterized protein YndB with AHSA1/START domain
MSTPRISRRINAPRAAVYRALLDARAVAAWRVPDGMTSQVHEFDAREGGRFRVSLRYDAPTGAGKTSPNTDTYHGYFAKLVPDEQVVELVEFETQDPAMQGEMKITTTLTDADGGTEIAVTYEGLPPGLPEAANETGTRMALAKLAALVERDIDAWFAELDRFADVPFMEDGRRQPPMPEPKDLLRQQQGYAAHSPRCKDTR